MNRGIVAVFVGLILLGIVGLSCGSEENQQVVVDGATVVVVMTPTSLPAPTRTAIPSATPVGFKPAIDPSFLALREELAEVVGSYGVVGEYAVAVTDLQTGETISVNGSRPQLAGCTANFFVLLAATLGVQSGIFAEEKVGNLISQTIWSSNPVTARTLYSIIGEGSAVEGVGRVQRLVEDRLGLSSIIIDHPPAYPEESRGVNSDNWVTAEQLNESLAILYRGGILEPAWRDYLLAKMVEVKPGLNYLTAYGTGGVVSHKNGFFANSSGWIDNDIGIVRFERGGVIYAYAISLLSQKVPWKYGDIPLGQRISELVWGYFNGKYY